MGIQGSKGTNLRLLPNRRMRGKSPPRLAEVVKVGSIIPKEGSGAAVNGAEAGVGSHRAKVANGDGIRSWMSEEKGIEVKREKRKRG